MLRFQNNLILLKKWVWKKKIKNLLKEKICIVYLLPDWFFLKMNFMNFSLIWTIKMKKGQIIIEKWIKKKGFCFEIFKHVTKSTTFKI